MPTVFRRLHFGDQFGVALLTFCVFCTFARGQHPDDVAAMKAVLPYAQNWPPDWREDNLTQICLWSGIICNEQGRVNWINLDAVETKAWMTGEISPYFLNFTELTVLGFQKTSLMSGTIPPELLQKPNLQAFVSRATAQSIVLPESITPALAYLQLSSLNISGALPSAWVVPNLKKIELERVNLNCPLPPWLLDAIYGDQLTWGCFLSGNNFPIIDGKLCGQLNITDAKCETIPTVNPLPKPPTLEKATHWFGNQHVHVRLSERVVFVFGVNNKTGNYSTDEYLALEIQGWTFNGTRAPILVTGVSPDLTQTEADGITKYSMNFTMSNGMDMEFFFYLNHPKAPRGVKFAFAIHRDPTLPEAEQPLPFYQISEKLTVAFAWYTRQPHSGLEPFGCKQPEPGFSFTMTCTSDIYQQYSSVDGAPECQVFSATSRSNNTEINFSYPLCYTHDGLLDYINKGQGDVTANGVGNAYVMGRLKQITGNNNAAVRDKWTYIDSKEQFIVLTSQISFAAFDRVLEFDPDISISLLFDSDTTGNNETLSIVGVAVGVSVAAVAAVAIVAVLAVPKIRYAVMPFSRPKANSIIFGKSDLDAVQASPGTGPQRSNWAAKPQNYLTNVK